MQHWLAKYRRAEVECGVQVRLCYFNLLKTYHEVPRMHFLKSVLCHCFFCWVTWWVLIITPFIIWLISAMLLLNWLPSHIIRVIPVIPVQPPVSHSFSSSVALWLVYMVSRQHPIFCICVALPCLSKYADSPLAPPPPLVLTCSWSNRKAHPEGLCERCLLSLALQIWTACIH